MVLYLDANTFVIAAESADARGDKMRAILRDAARGTEQCVTSILSWDEVFWAVKKQFGREKANEQAEWLLDLPGLSLVSATEEIARQATNLVKKYSMNPRDAIHLATAIENDCAAFVTSDSDFDKVTEIKTIKI